MENNNVVESELLGEKNEADVISALKNLSKIEIGSSIKGNVLKFSCTLDATCFTCLWNDKKVKKIICSSEDGSIISIKKKNFDYCVAINIK